MRLRLLMLTGTPTGAAAVDLDTGALRRIVWREPVADFSTYDVVEAQGLAGDALPFPADMSSAIDPVAVGCLAPRKAERWLRPLVHPGHLPLLGGVTNTVAYWTLASDSPSVTLVSPAAGPVVERDGAARLRCRFRAGRVDHDLPVQDARLEERLSHPAATRLAGGTLARALGRRPGRLLVALTPPDAGRCHKVVAGML